MTPQDIAKLIEANHRAIELLNTPQTERTAIALLYELAERQQQLISYLLERDQQRTGDNR